MEAFAFHLLYALVTSTRRLSSFKWMDCYRDGVHTVALKDSRAFFSFHKRIVVLFLGIYFALAVPLHVVLRNWHRFDVYFVSELFPETFPVSVGDCVWTTLRFAVSPSVGLLPVECSLDNLWSMHPHRDSDQFISHSLNTNRIDNNDH